MGAGSSNEAQQALLAVRRKRPSNGFNLARHPEEVIISEITLKCTFQMQACELQISQWATPADLEISSQIVICCCLHAIICDISFFAYVVVEPR